MFANNGFKVLKGLTDAVVNRQGLLSNNLTNIETEGYVRKDINFSNVLSGLKNDIGIDQTNESTIAQATYDDHGNKVTLETELSQMYDNHLRYLLLVKGVNSHFEHMKKALEVRGA